MSPYQPTAASLPCTEAGVGEVVAAAAGGTTAGRVGGTEGAVGTAGRAAAALGPAVAAAAPRVGVPTGGGEVLSTRGLKE